MKRSLTEIMPEALAKTHECKWQKVSEDAESMILVCADAKCGQTKRVEKPKPITENKSSKRTLYG